MPDRHFTDNLRSVTPEEMAKIPVVSYFRVSTVGQADKDRSGLDRQEEATHDGWFGKYSHQYELVENVTQEGISGAKKGRFDWFLNGLEKGDYAPGTVLLCERVSRFGRMRASDTIEQLQLIWNAGGITAFTDISGGKPFGKDGLDDETGLIFELFGAIRQSRREWLEKQARSLGAYDKRTKLLKQYADGIHCVYGDFRFKPRGKDSKGAKYPFWLNAQVNGKWKVYQEQLKWILHAFELNIQGIGAPRIAAKLNESGYTRARGAKFTTSDVGQILRNRALLGEFEYTVGYDADEKPIKDCIKAVYPTVVSPELFKEAEDARKETGMGRKNPNGTKMNNLFEKRCRCVHCGGIVGVRNGRNESKALFCRNKSEGKGCDTPNVLYDEVKLLNRLANFRWEEFFGNPKHDAERAVAAAEVERCAQLEATAQGIVDNLEKSVEEAVLAGDGAGIAVITANRLLPEKQEDLRQAAVRHAVARRKLDNLKRRRNSAAASKDARNRIKAFIKGGREDIEQRREFNLWMRDRGLVFAVDLHRNTLDLGVEIVEDGELVGIDHRLEDAAAFGATPQQIADLEADIARKNANLAEQRVQARKAEEERRRNRVPHSPEDKAAIKAWVEQKQKEVAERDRLRQQQAQQQQ